jgi:calmodulin
MGAKQDKVADDEIEAKRLENILEIEKQKYGEIDLFFHKFDYNNVNFLNDKEFREAIKAYVKIHPEKEKNLNELILHLDLGVHTQIYLDDFRKIMTIYLEDEMKIENMIDVFKCFDKNLQGQIGTSEIKHVFSKLGLNLTDEEALELIKESDVDGDETMDFEEFLKIMIAK